MLINTDLTQDDALRKTGLSFERSVHHLNGGINKVSRAGCMIGVFGTRFYD